MKHVVSVIGARPQFIKLGPLSRQLRQHYRETVIHTGQHYDDNMSQIFFEQMQLPRPDHNLEAGSGTLGAMTARMLEGIEKLLLELKPNLLLVFGDTNSTLAGALAAGKLHIPVAHVEAGLRSFNRRMPEEINRVLTDHVSSLLFCPTEVAVGHLRSEGIEQGVFRTGDVMYDALLHFRPLAEKHSRILEQLDLRAGEFNLLTIHRAENTDDPERLRGILTGLRATDKPLVFPVHPRTRRFLKANQQLLEAIPDLRLLDPVGFLDMLRLEATAGRILTDSGGVQKEAYWWETPCITLRDETEWVETVDAGWNVLVGADSEQLAAALQHFFPTHRTPHLYGDGEASRQMTGHIQDFFAL